MYKVVNGILEAWGWGAIKLNNGEKSLKTVLKYIKSIENLTESKRSLTKYLFENLTPSLGLFLERADFLSTEFPPPLENPVSAPAYNP